MPLKVAVFCTSVERIAWAKASGCPWTPGLGGGHSGPCSFAAAGGHLEVLKWACVRDARTCFAAAQGGHLEVLKWARKHHCPWDALTRQYAEQQESLEVLQWAAEHGAP